MKKIKQLSEQDIQKIAAGQVLERPVNAVKELIENSIDAGSTAISLYIEDGGKQLIRIIDNGSGMDPEDAKASILRHTTSKIESIADLDKLQTFGFRGEALASICAVSKVTIKTKTANDLCGILLEIEACQIIKTEVVSCNTGTEICIKNLFDNIPARKKFLKSKDTEYKAIAQLFFAMAICYEKIYFKLYSQDRLIYNLVPEQTKTKRIAQIFDRELIEHALEITENPTDKSCKVYGVISDQHYSRYDRSQIYMFVNNRWVKNFKLSQAINRGYQDVLGQGKYPAVFLFIQVDPLTVDVNIHPKKEEVAFLHPKNIENNISFSIKQKLEDNVKFRIKNINSQNFVIPENNFIKHAEIQDIFSKNLDNKNLENRDAFLNTINKSFSQDWKPTIYTQSVESLPVINIQQEIAKKEHDYKILGQLHKTYILIENKEGLVLIDQHAAHERIVYQKLSKKFEIVDVTGLLIPQIIKLQGHDLENIIQNIDILEKNGIHAYQFGPNELAIKALPIDLQKNSIEELIRYIASLIRENGKELENSDIKKLIHEKIHAQMACKAAIKAGDVLSLFQMENLVQELYNTENRLTCPHSRPTIWNISLYEIEKKFKRV